MKKENIKEAIIDVTKGTIKTVASIYILKNRIENAIIAAACNTVNKYVFNDEKPMFD